MEWVEPAFQPASRCFLKRLRTNAADMVFSPEETPCDSRSGELFPLAGIPIDDVERYLDVSRLVGELDSVQVEIARSYLNGDLEYETCSCSVRGTRPHGISGSDTKVPE